MAVRPSRPAQEISTVEALVYLDTALVVVLVIAGHRWALAGLVGLWLVGRARAP